ncbi:MAG: RNA polymerase sigma factor [Pseudomonadota bacterium]|nr:RNA polymerase sigma factor [Pseudomonadota bacterium]
MNHTQMSMNMRKTEWIEQLFCAHGSALQAFFRRRIRLACDAADLSQEVYLRMLRVKDIEAIRNPELYIYTVANNLVKEHAIFQCRCNACDDIDNLAVQEQLAESPQFDGEIDSWNRTHRLREVLAQLSPKCRAAVVLQYRDGLSYHEIANRLGISTHMVKKYLSRALGHCRRRMELLR